MSPKSGGTTIRFQQIASSGSPFPFFNRNSLGHLRMIGARLSTNGLELFDRFPSEDARNNDSNEYHVHITVVPNTSQHTLKNHLHPHCIVLIVAPF